MIGEPVSRKMRSDELAFGVVVLASYVMLFSSGALTTRRPGFLLLMTALMLVYLLFGIFGNRYFLRKKSALTALLFFGGEMAIGGLINYLGYGSPWLLLLPVVSQAIMDLPRPVAALVCLLIMVLVLLPVMVAGQWTMALSGGIAYLAAMVFVAVFTLLLISQQRAREELSAANQKLREYATRVEELATAQERNRLAREIHDGLGHYLTAINIQIKAARAVLRDQPDQAAAALANAETLASEALADVRRSVSALRADPSTSRPLAENLESLLAETRSAGVEVSLEVRGQPRPLPEAVEFTLFRTAQEGLTNVRKHARASQSSLALDYGGNRVVLEVRDNGVGSEDLEGGYGLTGLRERVDLLSGSLQITTSPGQGFCLRVELPVEPPPAG